MITGITLRHLRYAEAVARHRHFGRAAVDCSVSQPALSMQIKELERLLGSRLFERSNRRVQPTAFGEAFAERATAILTAVDDLADLARDARGRFAGTLRLGVIPTIAPYLLPAVIEHVGRRLPELRLTVRETITAKLIDDLRDGRLDAALVALPVSEPGIAELAIVTEPFVFIRPSSHAGRPVPGPRQLREMRLLLLEEGHCFREQALSFCDLAPGGPREVLDGSTLTTLVQMVAADMGVTLIPQMATRIETRLADVDVAQFPHPPPTRTIGLVHRASSPLAERFLEFRDVVRQACGENPSSA